MTKPFGISFVSSYVPRRCGIATFTNDLATSINNLTNNGDFSVNIAALNDIPEGYKYTSDVKLEINDKIVNDFKEAAYFLNLSESDVVNIQHEFGLYGGEAGSNILYLYEKLNKPIVTTLHTVLESPSEEQFRIIEEIGDRSSYFTVQSKRALKMLERIYKISPDKIRFIAHGAHDVPFLDPTYYKDKFQLTEKKVILTFGLLGPGKGIEDVINSLPAVVKGYPKLMYVILGATHPNVKRNFGESYRNSLENLVKKNGLENNVMFINRFVDTSLLLEFLLMSDIYVSPYRNKEQVVSGTLTYALACGKAVVSTPYWHAQELLADDRGVLVPFNDPESLSLVLTDLLKDENKRNKLRKKAYDAGRDMIWPKIGESYTKLFIKAVENYKLNTNLPPARYKTMPSLPDVNFTHLKNLTDSTGIFQHATYSIPNPNEGYCTDDNVRALLVAFMYRLNFNDEKMDKYINKYLTFVYHSFNQEKALFRNFMTYDRRWIEEVGAEDCNGRVIFVFGYMIKNTTSLSTLGLTKNLFDQSINKMSGFRSPRAMAYIIIGSIFYLNKFSGAREVKKILRNLSTKLLEFYNENKTKDWKWYETSLTYLNARLPQALIMAGEFLNNETLIAAGIESLTWLFDVLYDKEKKYLSLIGNDGWYVKGGSRAKYDQQPIEIPPLVDACYQAYLVTHQKEWINKLIIAFSWFLGNNERQELLCDFATGGCFDGLNSNMVNQNQGAESTVSWLLSLLRMIRIREDLQIEK